MKPLPRTTKVDDTSIVEGQHFCISVDPPEVPGRPGLTFGEHVECLESLRALWHLHAEAEQEEEEEGRVLYAQTWYSDATRWPNCEEPRSIRLLNKSSATWQFVGNYIHYPTS